MNEFLATGGIAGGVLAVVQVAWGIIQDARGGGLRKSRAEAAKTTLDVTQAEASLPHVTDALRLGNVADAVAIQQQVINGLRDHAVWADEQIKSRDARIEELEARLASRDERIEELERRLDVAEAAVKDSRLIIDELRATSRAEQHPTH